MQELHNDWKKPGVYQEAWLASIAQELHCCKHQIEPILNTSNEAAASTDGYNYFVDYTRYGGIDLVSLLHCRNLQVQNTVNRPYLWRKIEIFFLSPTAQVKATEGTNGGRKTRASQISAECVSGLSSHCSKVSTIHWMALIKCLDSGVTLVVEIK